MSAPAGPGRGTALGADIGGTAIKLGRLDGASRAEREIPTDPDSGSGSLAERLSAAWRELLLPGEAVPPLGIGCAGLIDAGSGEVVTSANLPGWSREPLADRVASLMGRRPVLLNDASAFVLAESRLGAGRAHGAGTIVGLAIGTGVGGGLVIDGRLYEGPRGFAGEPGHMPIDLDGPVCACGARGCLEAMIGTRAIQAAYARRRGEATVHTPREIFERAEAGDAAAAEVWEEIGAILGRALTGLTHLLDPDLIVVGGGIARAGERLLAPARRSFAQTVMAPEGLRPTIVPAALANAAGWIGAALRARDEETP
ncbi:MAG: ROK family protein [Candidatus Eisenbacteria bacterium]|nr:ROK family protein [Candidatus Eisenbacteria bacterium]